jgi:cell filamentation protein
VKKLTDKQKSRLWEQQRNVNLQASCLLEKGNGPSEPHIETLELGPSAPGLPHLCLIHRHLYRSEMKRAGELRTDDIFKGDIPFCHFEYIEKMGNELMAALEAGVGQINVESSAELETLNAVAGQLGLKAKDKMSHRSKALRRAREFLRKYL